MENFDAPVFQSFFMGGFECSCQRRKDGRRLDLIAATQHDLHAAADYARLLSQGLHVARDGIRWHLIETQSGHYDWSSVLPMLRAARSTGLQVIWDICHYGWPDDIDIFTPAFVERFARFAGAFAQLVKDEMDEIPVYVPINEISFWTWGSAVGYLNPFAEGRPHDIKQQLVRAAIAGIEAIWAVDRRARIVHADPLVNVVPHPDRPHEASTAENRRLAQFESWDMLAGLQSPELGGRPAYLDIIGGNYYPHNQWIYDLPHSEGITIRRWSRLYRPFRTILGEVYERYRRPILITETGAENGPRAGWLRYVGREVRAALAADVPILGICLYPIMNRPGWDDERHCYDGLWDYCDDSGERELYQPLARELKRQMHLMERLVPQFSMADDDRPAFTLPLFLTPRPTTHVRQDAPGEQGRR